MDLTLPVICTIISVTIGAITFALNRKDKSNKDTEDASYKRGLLDQQLKDIIAKLDKIEKKLDNYDNEILIKIEKAINQHIEQYHKRSAK